MKQIRIVKRPRPRPRPDETDGRIFPSIRPDKPTI